jgi:hypothetical protein
MPNFGAAKEALGPLTPQFVDSLQHGVCILHDTYCASSPQYVNVQDCVSFLQNLPVGTFDRVNSNSTVCRAFHGTFALSLRKLNALI